MVSYEYEYVLSRWLVMLTISAVSPMMTLSGIKCKMQQPQLQGVGENVQVALTVMLQVVLQVTLQQNQSV